MEKNLAVPYQSQHGSDSKVSNNDCGPASLAQVLTFLGKPITTGEVLAKLGNPTGYTSIQDLTKVAQDLGFSVESKIDTTFNELKAYIDKGLPVIVVGGYGYLNSTQDKEFKGSHIMVVVGYRADDSVYVNDPDFWGQYLKDGDHHVYTAEEFFTFWRNEGNTEGNQPNILFVVSPKVEVAMKVTVTADKGLNARSIPDTKGNIITVYSKGTFLDITDKVNGETVSSNNVWFKTGDAFVWSGGVQEVKEEKPKDPPKGDGKPAVVADKDKIIKELQKENKKLLDTLKKLNEITDTFMIIKPEEPAVKNAPLVDNLLELLHIK